MNVEDRRALLHPAGLKVALCQARRSGYVPVRLEPVMGVRQVEHTPSRLVQKHLVLRVRQEGPYQLARQR